MEPIAIVGMASILPGSRRFRDCWRDILSQKCFIKDVSPDYWSKQDYYDPNPKAVDKTYAYKGGFIDPIDFEPLAFGIPPKILPETDTSQLIALVVAQEVLKDAFQNPSAHTNVSVILGATASTKLFYEAAQRLCHAQIKKAMKAAHISNDKIEEVIGFFQAQFVNWEENTFPGLLPNVIAGRITNRLDLDGENCTVDAACASALAAMNMGIQKLQLNQADIVISGGVDTLNGPPNFVCFSKTPALSPTQICRPFDKNADGMMLGEGIVMFTLKRLSDAKKDKNKIYAVIKGIGSSSDGKQKSIYAPAPQGQIKALERCYQNAGYDASTITLLEAHGTGTKAGDKAEIETLKEFFEGTAQKCAVGSVKSQYGHTKAAAGATGLLKAVCSLYHKILPPTINVDEPVDMEKSNFYINTKTLPWFNFEQHKRRAGISSFGFGGTNYHITLEEYENPTHKINILSHNLLLFSSQTKEELNKHIESFKNDLENAYIFSEFIDYRIANQTFNPKDLFKVAIITKDKEQLLVQLENLENAQNVFYTNNQSAPDGVVFEIPDKLELYEGVELAYTFDCVRKIFEKAGKTICNTLYPKICFSKEAYQTLQTNLNEQKDTIKSVVHKAIAALFNTFGINENPRSHYKIKLEHMTQCWFMKTLGKLASLGHPIDYSLFFNEFGLDYDQVQKPKFSVKIAGYNYGKPIFNKE